MSSRHRVSDHTLTVEIAAEREQVWRALVGELNVRGSHVQIEEHEPPEHLRLRLQPRAGEVQTLDYHLEALDGDNTAVTATVYTRGALYVLKRLLSFRRIDELYLHAVAVGLANLQRHLEGTAEVEVESADERDDE